MATQSQGLRQIQKQTQNLVLAPQLRQSLKILQAPALDLRTLILEELQTNPLLEELTLGDESLDAEHIHFCIYIKSRLNNVKLLFMQKLRQRGIMMLLFMSPVPEVAQDPQGCHGKDGRPPVL